MNTGMGWAAFWPSLAKVIVAGAVLWFGLEALDVVREVASV